MTDDIHTVSNSGEHKLFAISEAATNLCKRERKERKGSSYVWIYCDKLSRHTIRCKLCDKAMSFHGTANVITHLQRKHNIMGKPDNGASEPLSNTAEEDISSKDIDEDDTKPTNRRSSISSSVVWKYCKRVSKDVVRCGFCKKNLSYQGTSNLQRHLHRMHGVASRGRTVKPIMSDDEEELLSKNEYIWEFCTTLSNDQTKCNLCNQIVETKAKIIKHLMNAHAIKAPKTNKPMFTYSEESQNNDSDDNSYFSRFRKTNDVKMDGDYDDSAIRKDNELFDELIEEINEQPNSSYEEDPFDTNLSHEMKQTNPLSPPTSREHSPYRDYMQQTKFKSATMKKLYEEKICMETEYFREKAGYYKMQKYLAALEAKKVRLELERLSNNEINVASFTVSDSLPNSLAT